MDMRAVFCKIAVISLALPGNLIVSALQPRNEWLCKKVIQEVQRDPEMNALAFTHGLGIFSGLKTNKQIDLPEGCSSWKRGEAMQP